MLDDWHNPDPHRRPSTPDGPAVFDTVGALSLLTIDTNQTPIDAHRCQRALQRTHAFLPRCPNCAEPVLPPRKILKNSAHPSATLHLQRKPQLDFLFHPDQQVPDSCFANDSTAAGLAIERYITTSPSHGVSSGPFSPFHGPHLTLPSTLSSPVPSPDALASRASSQARPPHPCPGLARRRPGDPVPVASPWVLPLATLLG